MSTSNQSLDPIVNRGVVVTGTSVIILRTHDVSEVGSYVCFGPDGICSVETFDCSDFAVRFGGKTKGFYVRLERCEVRRFGLLVVAQVPKNVTQAGLDFSAGTPYRRASVVEARVGGLAKSRRCTTASSNAAQIWCQSCPS